VTGVQTCALPIFPAKNIDASLSEDGWKQVNEFFDNQLKDTVIKFQGKATVPAIVADKLLKAAPVLAADTLYRESERYGFTMELSTEGASE
jgi:hypothetical protein